MYPFGSGMPTQNHQQSPYPNQGNNIPFGSGNWNQPNQQASSQPYQQNNQPYSPYPTNNMPPYPSSQPPYSVPSNPHQQYQSFSSNQPYPNNQASYQQGNFPVAPFGAGFYVKNQNSQRNSTPYPSNSTCPYPNSNPSSTQNLIGGECPYTAQSNYPAQSYSAQYPIQSSSCPYPPTNTHQNTIAASNIAQCFNEMRHSISSVASPSSSVRSKGAPTIVPPQNFDPVKDAHALRKAMKGFGTDEDALIEIICRRSNEQRQEIQRQYKTHFGKDLIEDIKSETSGNFEKLLIGLLRPIVDFYCIELCDAMKGIGTDEDVLIEILCTLSNSEIHTIKNQYLRMYGAHLESELKSETSGNFKRLLVSLCAAARDECGRIDPVAAQNDARELLKAGELRVGTDESMFNMVLCQRNYQQLKLILNEYENITGHSLEKAIKHEFSGDIQEGLLAICKCVTNKTEYFASRLHKSMAGIGTNDRQLIRVIVTRSEIDLQDIKNTFERLYGKSLKSWIKGDTSGHYKHALYALIGEQRSS